MEEDDEKMMMNNVRSRRKKSSVGIICCFTGTCSSQHQRRASFDGTSSYSSVSHPSPRWSPGWFKSKNHSLEVPAEVKGGKCRSFISRMGRHRRHASAEFSYDPLSYALNFNDDADVDDDSRAMSFSARFSGLSSPRRTPHAFDHDLPRSPPEAGHLNRGFESLAESIKMIKDPRNKSGLSSPSLSPKGSEEVTTPVGISSNREILVQLC